MPGERPPVRVELVPFTVADAQLTVALETDPRVMAELGGPWSVEEAIATHARRLQNVERHGTWWLKIVSVAEAVPVGALVLWDSEWAGEPLSEIGWMVLPEHQGKGYASAGLRLILERARADGHWGDIHAFPGASNEPSNALCRKFGFELVGEGDADYAGRHFRVNHWVLRAS
ncbi:MAG TPA: GNAT family N-acetyltransferase [Candidatus Deferrimicrobiaceae bacterium]|nr:GNAT family N-acetyltransferase [Candidatus Deferrimicrobiaceae bacterium]